MMAYQAWAIPLETMILQVNKLKHLKYDNQTSYEANVK